MAMNDSQRLGPSARWSALWGVGMVLIFLGERMIGAGAGAARGVATIGGLLCVLAATVVRALRGRQAAADRKQAENLLLSLYGFSLIALLIYFIQSDLPTLSGGLPL